ncbi:MAG: helix-turn-helix domain-containing protein [Tannerellaceae bacterium]|jgi:AraC-like DNA-binding protein|nr:helix-turn-helix domain-containing protein [Tannerellaceae bacterium]
MEDFQIIYPSPALAPYVKHYWLLKTVGGDTDVARTVPTGMMSLIFHRGNRLLSVHENTFHPRTFLNGQERTFADLQYDGQVNMITVVFRPAGVRAFFDLPINRLTGLRLTAGDMEDRELAALENSLTSTGDDGMCILLIEQFLFRRLMRLAEHNLKRIETTIRLINSGETNVTALADTACLSRKQFDRIFSEYVGAHPKEFSRTVRFQRALYKLETNPQISWAALAADCGYFDQSHMIREFRSLSGYTPGEYLAACPPHSDYFS